MAMAEGPAAQSTSARPGETVQAAVQRDPSTTAVYEENGASVGFISIMSMICHLAALFLIPWLRSYINKLLPLLSDEDCAEETTDTEDTEHWSCLA